MEINRSTACRKVILITSFLATLILGFLVVTDHTYADVQSQTTCSETTSQSSSSEQTIVFKESASNSDNVDSSTDTTLNNTSDSQSNNQNATTSNQSSTSGATTPAPSENTTDTSQPTSSVNGSSTPESTSSSSESANASSSTDESQVNNQSSSQDVTGTASSKDQGQTNTDSTSNDVDSTAGSSPVTDQSSSTDNTTTGGTNKDQITVTGTNSSTDPAIKQSSSNPLLNWLTNMTSAGAAALIYPFITSRQGSHLLSEFRTLLSPTRYNIDQTWSDLDQKYNPDYTKQFYTDAQNWYDNEVKKETLTVPFADGSGNASATYIAHPGSTKTIIYGQGWITEPEWMGYISKIFYDMGYNVLMPYTRGQNSSDGEFLTFGYKDKADWINWINKIDQLNGPNSEVVLYGQSLGADDALEAGAQKNLPSSVKAVIADCGYSTIPSLLYSLYTGAANKLNGYTSKIGWNLNGSIPLVPYDQFLNNLNNVNHLFQGFNLDDASGLTAVQNSTLPTLFIATADDTFIPDSETKALYNASISKDKQLWILDGNVGGHASANNAVLAYTQHIQDFLNAVDNGQTSSTTSTNQLTVNDNQTVAA
uniref:CocE/NonD family hydrolase n=1 Tax=Lentilactobacillus hilgardii TaxID=1588 RepID=UPI00403FA53A